MPKFQFQKLRVSEEAMGLVILVDGLAAILERHRRFYLCDQIRRAALSVLLNIGEAAAEYNPAEKARILGLARRSVEEVVIGLVVAVRLNLLSEAQIAASLDQADRVIGMLTRMIVYHRNNSQKRKMRHAVRNAPHPMNNIINVLQTNHSLRSAISIPDPRSSIRDPRLFLTPLFLHDLDVRGACEFLVNA